MRPVLWGLVMPSGLHRTYGAHHLHFITTSCYRRLPLSGQRALPGGWPTRASIYTTEAAPLVAVF